MVIQKIHKTFRSQQENKQPDLKNESKSLTKNDRQVPNKHMKRFSMSYVCKELQIKTIISTTAQLLERPKCRILRTMNVGNTECAEQELSLIGSKNVN